MAKHTKTKASKAKSVGGKKAAAKSAATKATAKTAARAKPAKNAASTARPASKAKSQNLKLKAHRAKQAAVKAAAKPKGKAAPAAKRAPAPKGQAKPLNKAINRKEQRLATLKAVGKKALEKVQAAAHQADAKVVPGKPIGSPPPAGKQKSTRGLTAKERALVKEFERRELSPADAEARRVRLKNLIVLGKERTFLTYAEINDHLPDDMMDAEQIENIIGMINDMGIQVYDEAPDADALLMSDVTPAVADEVAVEEAEAALSTVDSEFGRTTDPVRMYMREMGSVELLTREGEIEIAKRIEDGLKHMVLAISDRKST